MWKQSPTGPVNRGTPRRSVVGRRLDTECGDSNRRLLSFLEKTGRPLMALTIVRDKNLSYPRRRISILACAVLMKHVTQFTDTMARASHFANGCMSNSPRLSYPDGPVAYLNAGQEEAQADFSLALRNVPDDLGIKWLSEQAHLNRASMYRKLTELGSPQLSSLNAILENLGLRLTVKAREVGSALAFVDQIFHKPDKRSEPQTCVWMEQFRWTRPMPTAVMACRDQ